MTTIVQDVIDAFRGAGFEVRDGEGHQFAVSGSLDSAALLIEAVLSEPESAPWTTEPPTEQGIYWHWNGDTDCAPSVLSVLYSGSAKKCFVPMNLTYSGHAEMCDKYGGHWKRLHTPKLPD